jgi:RNA polymerase sigma-70 factor (ECF subfamily)
MAMPRTGDPLAPDHRQRFRRIFEEQFNYVWASLRRLGVHPRDLEDVAQELFVQVYRKLGEFDAERPVRPWLFAFAARCASDWRRLARHRVERLGEGAEPPADIAAAHRMQRQVEGREDLELVLRALECVGEERREVFILHELDGLTMKEISDLFGIPQATGYSRLRVAREEFTAAVRRHDPSRGAR